MAYQERVVQTSALPLNRINPLEPGSTNIFDSAIIKQNNQNQLQNKLASQTGGKKNKNCKYKLSQLGGFSNIKPPVVIVSPTPSYAVDKDGTMSNNIAIAKLANNTQTQAALDNTVNGNQSDVALISAKQQALYYGKGGRQKKIKKKSKKHTKNCNKKTKKTKKTKKRNYIKR